jgi:hypothetical protein
MNEHEAAAAEIAGARQGDGERETDRDGGVDGVPARFQDVHPDPGRARFLGRHHSVSGQRRQGSGTIRQDGGRSASRHAGRHALAVSEGRGQKCKQRHQAGQPSRPPRPGRPTCSRASWLGSASVVSHVTPHASRRSQAFVGLSVAHRIQRREGARARLGFKHDASRRRTFPDRPWRPRTRRPQTRRATPPRC